MVSRKHSCHYGNACGFTLIEVLVAVVIVGIIASIALPAYSEYVVRSKLPEASAELSSKRARLEAFYDNNRTYLGAADCTASSGKNFDFSCSGVTANAYTIQATGKNTMAGFTFTIDETNAKKTPSVAAGWTSNATCWVVRKDGSC